jgi:signal transduction histidine kinase/CheY-like chemotaxis protein
MKLGDLGVRQRLFIGFGVLLVLLGLELSYTFSWFRRLDHLRDALSDDVGPRAEAASRLERAVLFRAVSLRNYGLTRDKQYLHAQAQAFEDAKTAMRDLDVLARRPEGRAIVSEMKPVAEAWEAAAEKLLAMMEPGAPPEQLAAAEIETATTREKLFRVARRFSQYQQRKLATVNSSIADAQRTMSWGLPCLGLLFLATILVTAFVVTRAVVDPVRDLLAAARSLAKGDYRRALALDPGGGPSGPGHSQRHPNELREFARAFAHAAARLQQREAALAADVQLSGIFSTRLAVNELADNALRAIAVLARAELGAVYVLDEGRSTLQRAASFPLDVHAPTLAIGEGIPGQAALQRSLIHVRDIPADTPFRVRLGVDDLPPKAVLAVPALLRSRVHGVIVLASLREFTDEGVRFVQHAANLLAPSLANAVAHREVLRFRAALQQKNEQLKVRNEELQAQREEIQAQNEELQSQNEELQSQREKIQGQNEELQAQNEELQSQREEIQAQNEELHAQRDELQDQGERLREAVERSEKADRKKDEFLATLGHELRNPLAAIDHAAQVLERRAPEAVSKPVGIVSRQARRLARLVDDLLDITRITEGKLVLDRRPVDMGQILRQAAESSRAFMEMRRHEPSITIGEGVLAVDGDPARLEQVVCNLLHNAAKFTPGGGTVSASVGLEGDRVILRVKDTGVGIDQELLPRVFDIFTQGAPSLARQEGLGVGLSLVRGLVEMHGGRVEAVSEGPERGSEFVVSLPGIDPDRVSRSAQLASRPAQSNSRSLRVLVVDDNPDVAESLAELVHEWGHEVHVQHTGHGALDAAARNASEVVLLDLGLPDMNGYELARELRRTLGPFSRTRIIALTGHGREEDRQGAVEAGCDLFFLKAASSDELRAALSDIARTSPGAEVA